MSYSGGTLAGWFDESVREHTRSAARRMAHDGGRRMTELTVMNTPIGPARLDHLYANLRRGWRQKPVMQVVSTTGGPAAIGFESGVETNVSYAPEIEFGWGLWGPLRRKYVIKPKRPGGWLSWVDARTGKRVFARQVLHPGAPGQHMVAIAVAVSEHELGVICEVALHDWAREVERANTRVVHWQGR